MTDNTQRFSERVADYIKYRPHYPERLVQILEETIKLDPAKIIADIGAGTGISSLPFLQKGYMVMGVEPNKEMREAAEQSLSHFSNFKSVDGTAEKTNLQDNSVDLIFCGQAFHWFNQQKSKLEFNRILRQGGNIVLVWNERSIKSALQQAYEQILNDHIEEYKAVHHRNIDEKLIAAFFAPKALHCISLPNNQILDFTGLVGRLRSSSYCPKTGPQYDALMKAIKLLFDKYQNDGTIAFEYETKVYWC